MILRSFAFVLAFSVVFFHFMKMECGEKKGRTIDISGRVFLKKDDNTNDMKQQ
jgi:hypothetical protein